MPDDLAWLLAEIREETDELVREVDRVVQEATSYASGHADSITRIRFEIEELTEKHIESCESPPECGVCRLIRKAHPLPSIFVVRQPSTFTRLMNKLFG